MGGNGASDERTEQGVPESKVSKKGKEKEVEASGKTTSNEIITEDKKTDRNETDTAGKKTRREQLAIKSTIPANPADRPFRKYRVKLNHTPANTDPTSPVKGRRFVPAEWIQKVEGHLVNTEGRR